MDNIHCHVPFDNRHESANFIARREAEYWLTPQGKLIEHTSYQINRRKLLIIVLAVVLAGVFIIGVYMTYAYYKYNLTEKEVDEISDACVAENKEEAFAEESTFFDRCSSEYLSETEAWEYYEQEGPFQLQFCINFMYARHGYAFKPGDVNDIYFNKQEWYQKLEKRKVYYEDLNSFEQKNSDLFFKILEVEGYRD